MQGEDLYHRDFEDLTIVLAGEMDFICKSKKLRKMELKLNVIWIIV